MGGAIEVNRPDGADVATYLAGPLWAAEWIGEPGDVTVRWSRTPESLVVLVGHPADYLG